MAEATARTGKMDLEGALLHAKAAIGQERIPLYFRCLERGDTGMPGSVVISHPESKEALRTLEAMLLGFFALRNTLDESFDEEEANILSFAHSRQDDSLTGIIGNLDFHGTPPEAARSVLREYKRVAIDGRSELAGLADETARYARSVNATAKAFAEQKGIHGPGERPFNAGGTGSPQAGKTIKRLIVGNEDVAGHLSDEDHLLACYDPVLMTNPALITPHSSVRPRVILLEGAPGTGKTELIKYSTDSLLSLAYHRGVPAQVTVFDNSFWNKYLGESTANFRLMLDGPIKDGSIARYVLDDVESIIPRRDSETGGEAGRRVIKELLTFLDDTAGRYRGQFDVFISTNYRSMIDPALLSRVTHSYEVRGPRTKEHYLSALFDCHLRDWSSHVDLDQDNKDEIAGLCEEFRFTGRDLYAISELVIDHIRNPAAYDESLFAQRGERFQEELLSRYRPAGVEYVRDAVHDRGMEKVREALLDKKRRIGEERERIGIRLEAMKQLGLHPMEGMDSLSSSALDHGPAYKEIKTMYGHQR